MQKQRIGLLSIRKARWPMNLLPMRYIICRMRNWPSGFEIIINVVLPILTDGHEASRLEFRQMPFPKFDDTKYQDGI